MKQTQVNIEWHHLQVTRNTNIARLFTRPGHITGIYSLSEEILENDDDNRDNVKLSRHRGQPDVFIYSNNIKDFILHESPRHMNNWQNMYHIKKYTLYNIKLLSYIGYNRYGFRPFTMMQT